MSNDNNPDVDNNQSPISSEDSEWLRRLRSIPVEVYFEDVVSTVCSAPPHRMGATPIQNEIARIQRLAEDRENDPTLQGTWAGNTTQTDMDSHQFPVEGEDVDCPCNDCNGVALFI